MRLDQVTKLEKENTAMSKKVDNDVRSASYDAIVIFSIYDRFQAIQKPDFGRMVCNFYIFFNSNLLLYKNRIQN